MEDKLQDTRRYQGLTLETSDPRKLFQECDREEKDSRRRLEQFKRGQLKTLKEELYKTLVFERPLFVPGEDERELRSFLRAVPRAQRASYRRFVHACWEHKALLGALRNARDNEQRWLILARWLKHEGIAQPEAFLSAGFLKHCAVRHFRGFSLTRILYGVLVHIWGPYFSRIRTDWLALEDQKEIYQIRNILEKKGYDPRAVAIFLRRREVVPAVCDWLSMRSEAAGR